MIQSQHDAPGVRRANSACANSEAGRANSEAVRPTRPGAAVAITGDAIPVYQLLVWRGALKLEILGMKRHGRSAYSIIKSELGLTGSRQKVLSQLEKLIGEAKASLAAHLEDRHA